MTNCVAPSLVYDHRVQYVSISSRALGIMKSLYVYVPPDIADSQRVPSLYFLRGHEREWINKHEDGTRGDTNVIDVYERLRAAGRIEPLVLVFPGLSSDDNRVPGLLINMRAPNLTEAAGIGTGQIQDYFFEELLPFVDTHFPTLNDGKRRGITGFSIGGAMAVKAAAQRPDLFCTAGAYDGTFLYAVNGGRQVRLSDLVIHNPMFDPAYNVPRDTAFIASNNAPNLVRRHPSALEHITWLIGYGPRNAEPWQANFYRGEHMVRCLRAYGLKNSFARGSLADGNHSWHTNDMFTEETLPMHAAALWKGL